MSKPACAQCTGCLELHILHTMLFCLNALLYVPVAHACILSCGVLLMLALSCRFSLNTLVGLHVAMLFEWCVQDLLSGHSWE